MFKFQRAILILLAVVCFGCAAMILPVVDLSRGRLASFTPYAGAPTQPEIVLLTNLLGGFRGLLVDAVWYRASKLQQEQKFWELYQLYDWIGKLEPHLEEVWVFNGWNMSYNLVAELSDSEARWQWIMRAIEWLRDQGLKYNPRSAKIMKEISWIFFHKMGRNADVHNLYYKHRWALMIREAMGSRDMQDVAGIAEAAQKYKTIDDLLREPDVAKALGEYRLGPPDDTIAQIAKAKEISALPTELITLLVKKGNESARKKVLNYFAARVLREVYKMDRFDVMVQMEEAYGKFDWRLPEAHAIYWAHLAREAGQQTTSFQKLLKDRLKHDRIILSCLQEAMRRGIIAYMSPNPNDPMIVTFDLGKVDGVNKFYEYMLDTYRIELDYYGHSSVGDGHEGFLKEIAFDLYFAGYTKEAQKYHLLRKKMYDKPLPFVPLKEFVLGQVDDFVNENATPSKMTAFVTNVLTNAYTLYCINSLDEARKLESLARDAWVAYLQFENANKNQQGQVKHGGLYTWEQMVQRVVATILAGKNPGFPPVLVPRFKDLLGVKGEVKIDRMHFEKPLIPPPVESSPGG